MDVPACLLEESKILGFLWDTRSGNSDLGIGLDQGKPWSREGCYLQIVLLFFISKYLYKFKSRYNTSCVLGDAFKPFLKPCFLKDQGA